MCIATWLWLTDMSLTSACLRQEKHGVCHTSLLPNIVFCLLHPPKGCPIKRPRQFLYSTNERNTNTEGPPTPEKKFAGSGTRNCLFESSFVYWMQPTLLARKYGNKTPALALITLVTEALIHWSPPTHQTFSSWHSLDVYISFPPTVQTKVLTRERLHIKGCHLQLNPVFLLPWTLYNQAHSSKQNQSLHPLANSLSSLPRAPQRVSAPTPFCLSDAHHIRANQSTCVKVIASITNWRPDQDGDIQFNPEYRNLCELVCCLLATE